MTIQLGSVLKKQENILRPKTSLTGNGMCGCGIIPNKKKISLTLKKSKK